MSSAAAHHRPQEPRDGPVATTLPGPLRSAPGRPPGAGARHARLPDWPERLAALIEQRRREPFAWGRHDCALWAADAVLAITGTDLAKPWRGRYRSAAGAVRIIHQQGAADAGLAALVDEALCRRLHVRQAQRGDVVLADMGAMNALGVVSGAGMWCGPGAQGLVFRPLREAVAAWEV